MKVIVDTSIWLEALRKKDTSDDIKQKLQQLIHEHRVIVPGPVRQELLAGARDSKQFLELKDRLRFFPDLPIQSDDYELAAEFFAVCRSRGIQGSHIDFLICAVSVHHQCLIYTADQDFYQFAKYLPIRLL